MCGFIGFFRASSSAKEIDGALIQPGLDHMIARGPDGSGVWKDNMVVLGHRRLAIIDTDTRATQPMQSSCGRYVVVFNGEIYNYKALRDDLIIRGVNLRTTSDTEVIIEMFRLYGAKILQRLHGMFAFVIWDKAAKRAFAARDPYGIKPLYFASCAGGMMVASQVKAILATGAVSLEGDIEGQASFWMLGSVAEPHTWYKAVRSLRAGHFMWISDGKVVSEECWSDVGEAWNTPSSLQCSDEELFDMVRSALQESVQRHVVADVPVGVFLSAGVDSTALAALMLEAGCNRLEGVTIAYKEYVGNEADEAPLAKLAAERMGIQHTLRCVTGDEFVADLPGIFASMDQPTIDGINTWYASKAAAEQGLKVVVSGVGGDELFFGYSNFRQLNRLVTIWRMLSRFPGAMQIAQAAARLQAGRTGVSRWHFAPEWSRSAAGAWWLRRSVFSPLDLPRLMGPENAAIALAGFNVDQEVKAMVGTLPDDIMLALAQIESKGYMRNQLLRDTDWAGMSHSVEIRTPLVDATLLSRLQPALSQLANVRGKAYLALAPHKALPPQIIHRKKTGFGIPISRWLKAGGVLDENFTHDWQAWAKYVGDTFANYRPAVIGKFSSESVVRPAFSLP